MGDLLDQLRDACARIASDSRHVRIHEDRVAPYAAGLPLDSPPASPGPIASPGPAASEALVAFWLTLAAINFGSGWFPTLRKREGQSGYYTIEAGLRARFATHGPWSAGELAQIGPAELAAALGQDPEHELIGLFVGSLRDIGEHVLGDCDSKFATLVADAHGSAVGLVERLARWGCFADSSSLRGIEAPFLKRAQIAAADLHRAGAARFTDLGRLTIFADNLVPHVLRLDGLLSFTPGLLERIESGVLIEHGSEEEIEIRACALQTVELIVAARAGAQPEPVTAALVDQLLWMRGQGVRYKASPRHRSRCTAY